jgi:GntR family transcriptional regulator/MocR family aminotransferase
MELALSLDRTAAVPLYQQLAEALRQAVLYKRLQPHQQLPPSRVLAQSLAISRVTVTQSYDQLVSEGYLETRPGAGTFVCGQLPEAYLQTDAVEQSLAAPGEPPQLSRFGHESARGAPPARTAAALFALAFAMAIPAQTLSL